MALIIGNSKGPGGALKEGIGQSLDYIAHDMAQQQLYKRQQANLQRERSQLEESLAPIYGQKDAKFLASQGREGAMKLILEGAKRGYVGQPQVEPQQQFNPLQPQPHMMQQGQGQGQVQAQGPQRPTQLPQGFAANFNPGQQQPQPQQMQGGAGGEGILGSLSRPQPLSEATKATLNQREDLFNRQKAFDEQQKILDRNLRERSLDIRENQLAYQNREQKSKREQDRIDKQLSESEKRQTKLNNDSESLRTQINKQESSADKLIKDYGTQLDLLRNGAVDGSRVGSNQISKNWPLATQNSASKQILATGQDIASTLSELQTGQQTISKIKFNESRKANLEQDYDTQEQRVLEGLKDASQLKLVGDLERYIINTNGGNVPDKFQHQLRTLYDKVHKVPIDTQDYEDGEEVEDKKQGVRWKVDGPIFRFDGFIEKGK